MPNAKGALPLPTGIVAVTVFVAVSITDTVPEFAFATKTLLPPGVTATPKGKRPTGIVAVSSDLAFLGDAGDSKSK